MAYRYIFRAMVLEIGGKAEEWWLGIESETPLDPMEWDGLIPADGMTEAETALVRRWIQA